MGLTWRTIIAALGTAAELVRSARTLREGVAELRDESKPSSAPVLLTGAESTAELNELRLRIERLERNETRQAELVARMADQIQALSGGLQLLADRVDKLLWVSVIALVLSSTFFLVELFRFLL